MNPRDWRKALCIRFAVSSSVAPARDSSVRGTMKDKVIIAGALANTGSQVRTHYLAFFLAENSDDLSVYVLQPSPGYISAAAFDWQAVLGTTADLFGIGGLLWAAYERFIKPIRDKNEDSNSFLYILVKHPSGQFIQFSLGKDMSNREDFIKIFSEKINEIIRWSRRSKQFCNYRHREFRYLGKNKEKVDRIKYAQQ